MPQHKTSTITHESVPELDMASALFANGDFDDVLEIVTPITKREDVDVEAKFRACQYKACVHSEREEWDECLEVLKISGPLIDCLPTDLRGKYHGQRALAHRNLNQINEALIDYEAARVCAWESGDEHIEANVRNNLAKVYSDRGSIDEAIYEVDAAIKMATRLRDDLNLGRFCDNKAQILIAAKRFHEALTFSRKAVTLLGGHPAGVEARSTHGLAMIHVGARYLDGKPKSIETFRARHDAAKMIDVELDVDLIKKALTRSNGQVLGAAKLLHVSHSVLIKLIARHGLERSPKRRRNKTLIAK